MVNGTNEAGNNNEIPEGVEQHQLSPAEVRSARLAVRALNHDLPALQTSFNEFQRAQTEFNTQIQTALAKIMERLPATQEGSGGTPVTTKPEGTPSATNDGTPVAETENQTPHATNVPVAHTTKTLKPTGDTTTSPTLAERVKIAVKPTTYNGQPNAVKTEEWITSCRNYLQMLKRSGNQYAVQILSQFLRGAALSAYQLRVAEQPFPDEDALFAWLRAEFTIVPYREHAFQQLKKLRGSGKKVTELRTALAQLRRILNFDDRWEIDNFLEALPPFLRSKMDNHPIMQQLDKAQSHEVYRVAAHYVLVLARCMFLFILLFNNSN